MGLHRTFLGAAAAALAIALPGQEPPALPPLDHVPRDHGNLFYLADVLPHLESLLGSRELSAQLERSPALSSLLSDQGIDLDSMRLQLRMVGSFVPREVLVAIPDQTLTDLARLLRATVSGAFATAFGRGTGDAEGAAREWESCAATLARVRPPRAFVYLRPRDLRTGERWFETVADALADFGETPGLSIEETADAIEVALDVGLGLQGPLQMLRRVAGIEGREPDPLAGIAGLEVRARLRLAEDGSLHLRIGEGGGEPRTVGDLGPLWPLQPRPLLFTTWSVDDAVAVVEEAYGSWLQYAETPEADWLWDNLPDGVPLAVLNLMEKMLDAFGSGSLAIRVDDGLDIRERMDIGGELELPSQSECSAVGLVPADAEVFVTSSVVTPDLFLSVVLESLRIEIEEQMARALSQGNHERTLMLSSFHTFLHERMEGLLDYIHGGESEVFEPGLALVLGEGAAVQELRVHDAKDEPVAVWRPGRLGFPALALIGHPQTADQAFAFADRLFAEVLVGFGVAGDGLRGEDQDLGLGVPTRVYGWHRFPLREGHRLHARGEAMLHCCVVDGLMVLSTSTALTRDIVAQARKGSRFRDAPPGEVGRSRGRGADLAGLLVLMGEWAAALTDPDGAGVFRAIGVSVPDDVADVRTGLEVLAELARMLGDIEQVETWEGQWYETHTRAELGR